MPEGITRRCRLVFMGSPDFAAQILMPLAQWCKERGCAEIVAVYTQPERARGRGHVVKPTPVKVLAEQLGICVYEPHSMRNEASLAQLRSLAPDYLLVAAYGQILPDQALAIPNRLALNVHASLLPAYRGAAPIERAILAGEQVHGVSIMQIVPELDAGPVYARCAFQIAGRDAKALSHALAQLGAIMLLRVIEGLEHSEVDVLGLKAVQDDLWPGLACDFFTQPEYQDASKATYASKLDRADFQVDLARGAEYLSRQVRAAGGNGAKLRVRILSVPLDAGEAEGVFSPNAITIAEPRNGIASFDLSILEGQASRYGAKNFPLDLDLVPPLPAGLLLRSCGGLYLSFADGLYEITRLKPASGKSMRAVDFSNGRLAKQRVRLEICGIIEESLQEHESTAKGRPGSPQKPQEVERPQNR